MPFQHSFTHPKAIAHFYAKIAVRALYDELALYPKPGLVSFIDNGAHNDMDASLFHRSLFGLRHYFRAVGLGALSGYKPAQLVQLGIQAEQTMYQITQGVNTHKGAIFALGILCASCCKLSSQKRSFSLQELHHLIMEDWAFYLQNHHSNPHTHGAWVKQKYAVADAKQWAIEGYRHVFFLYEELAFMQADKVLLGLWTYQRLLLVLDDINILYRTGLTGLHFAREQIKKLPWGSSKEQLIEEAISIHLVFSKKNISPGGVADMISFMYFLRHLFHKDFS